MNKLIIGIIIAVVVVGGGIYLFSGSENAPTQINTESNAPGTAAPVVNTNPTPITMADVVSHNSESSCYTFINGNVYDITSYIPKHPGGKDAVLKVCGTDGTSLFMGKHGASDKAKAMLETLKIGSIN